MIAKELISAQVMPLRTEITGSEALQWMEEYHLKHLPIVNNGILMGVISEDDIHHYSPEESIGWYTLSLNKPYVREQDHIYEVMRLLSDHRLTLIPVVDDNKRYLGSITLSDLLNYFANTSSFAEPGSIIVLEINKGGYSLSEIARIVEMENAIILSSFITSRPESTEIEVTIKVNHLDIRSILSAFTRYNYQIKASFTEEEYIDALRERYDSLMAYLEV